MVRFLIFSLFVITLIESQALAAIYELDELDPRHKMEINVVGEAELQKPGKSK